MPASPAQLTTQTLEDRLIFHIPAQKKPAGPLSMALVLFVLLLVEVSIFALIINRGTGPTAYPLALAYLFLSAWTICSAVAVYIQVWHWRGKEVIQVSEGVLCVSRVISGRTLPGFSKEYSAAHIRGLRLAAEPDTLDPRSWSHTGWKNGLIGGHIAFDYGSKTIYFGIGLDEDEAHQLRLKIFRKFPRYRADRQLDEQNDPLPTAEPDPNTQDSPQAYTPVALYPPRYTTRELDDTLLIHIPAQKQWGNMLSLAFGVLIWFFCAKFFLGDFSLAPGISEIDPAILFVLCPWAIFIVFTVFILIWQLLGEEVIRVSSQSLSIQHVLLGVNLPGFSKEYVLKHIKALHVSRLPDPKDLSRWARVAQRYGLSGGRLSFEYEIQTIRFGLGLEEIEAHQLLDKISQKLHSSRD